MLTGDRVELREVREADLPTIYDIFRELDTWEQRGPAAPGQLTWEGFCDFYLPTSRGKEVELVIAVEEVAVGRCCLREEDHFAGHASVGIALAAGARGQGYGTEALRLLVDFAFVRRNLRRLHLEVLADNLPAIASYRKVGFVEEGRAREHAYARGVYMDIVRMGLLRSEWQVG